MIKSFGLNSLYSKTTKRAIQVKSSFLRTTMPLSKLAYQKMVGMKNWKQAASALGFFFGAANSPIPEPQYGGREYFTNTKKMWNDLWYDIDYLSFHVYLSHTLPH